MMRRWFAVPLLVLALAACEDSAATAEAPPPVDPTREAITYFGRMILVDHDGPRGQIHLEDGTINWFPAVRDVVAFTLLPEESKDITAIYVSDMATAETWNDPQTWMPARDAVYVIESDARGGMGMPEAVPFSDRAAAEAFAETRGGRIVAWDAIPEDYILSAPDDAMDMTMDGGPMTHGEAGQ
jgi:copper chaperone NosL